VGGIANILAFIGIGSTQSNTRIQDYLVTNLPGQFAQPSTPMELGKAIYPTTKNTAHRRKRSNLTLHKLVYLHMGNYGWFCY